MYPANSVPAVVKRINQALQRADHIDHAEGRNEIDWFVPIVADAEAGFGGPLNVFELVKAMIEAGAAFDSFGRSTRERKKMRTHGRQSSGADTGRALAHLTAARLAADVCSVPTVVLARTDANAASLLTSDADERDRGFLTGDRTAEGFHRVRAGIDQAIARGLSYAPLADIIWCETAEPSIAEAKKFCRKHPRQISRQAVGLQLFALVQLEEEARQCNDCEVSTRTRRDGLQIPIRYPGRIPRAERQHV